MALDKVGLAQAIKNIRDLDFSSGAIENDLLAEAIAEAIDVYVKSGDVLIAGGSSAGTYKVT